MRKKLYIKHKEFVEWYFEGDENCHTAMTILKNKGKELLEKLDDLENL